MSGLFRWRLAPVRRLSTAVRERILYRSTEPNGLPRQTAGPLPGMCEHDTWSLTGRLWRPHHPRCPLRSWKVTAHQRGRSFAPVTGLDRSDFQDPRFTCLRRGVLAIVGYRLHSLSSSSSQASDSMATVRGCCQVRLVDMVSVRSSSNCWSGTAGPDSETRVASSWAVKATPKNSAIPVRLAHSNRAMTPVSGP